MKLSVSFFLVFISFGFLNAQDLSQKVWTINECLAYALENNLRVQQAKLEVDINKNNLQTANWDYAPNLNLSTSYGVNFGLSIDPVTNFVSRNQRQTANIGLSSNWVLYNGGRKYKTIAQRNLQYMAAMFDLDAVKNDISLNVTAFFLQILLNQEIYQVAQEQVRVTELQVKRMTKLVDAGSRPKGDLLQLEAQLARDKQNLISSENSIIISKLQLANLLQLEDPSAFNISEPELSIPDATLVIRPAQSIYVSAIEEQPAIKSAEKRVESSEKAVEISKGAALPTLSLNGQIATNYSDQILEATGTTLTEPRPIPTYDQNGNVIFFPFSEEVPSGFQNKDFGDQVNDNLNEYIGISLTVPLFNRLAVRNNYQNSQINYAISELQLEQEKTNFKQTVYQAHADGKASYNSYLAAEAAVASNEESFKYSSQRFEVGALNQFDYENAKNNLAIAKSEMIRAKYDYIFKIKVLEFYLTNQVNL